MLQRSLQERDRLRSDVAHAESVKKRREALEDAIRRFDRIMRSVLLSVSNSVETMDETARELARVSAVAEGEAVEAAFVSENTVSNVSTVRSATERLSAAISETVDGIRQAADVIALSSTAAQSASASAEGLAQTTAEIDAVMRAIADIAAQTNALALNATIQATRAANGSGNFAAVVGDIKALAGRIGNANEDIARRLGDHPRGDQRNGRLGAFDRAEARHRAAPDAHHRAGDGAAGRGDARDRRKHDGGGERLDQRVVERRAAEGHDRGRARRLDEGRHQGDRHGGRGASPRLDREVVPAGSDGLADLILECGTGFGQIVRKEADLAREPACVRRGAAAGSGGIVVETGCGRARAAGAAATTAAGRGESVSAGALAGLRSIAITRSISESGCAFGRNGSA